MGGCHIRRHRRSIKSCTASYKRIGAKSQECYPFILHVQEAGTRCIICTILDLAFVLMDTVKRWASTTTYACCGPLDPFEMGRGNRSKILHHVRRFPRSAFVSVEKGEEREGGVAALIRPQCTILQSIPLRRPKTPRPPTPPRHPSVHQSKTNLCRKSDRSWMRSDAHR